jgi:hypothetical protein
LSKPTTSPTSDTPDRRAWYAEMSAEPPVAQPFATLTKGMPVGPRSATIVSALPASWLPPYANSTSLHRTPASASARRAASTPIARPLTPS